MDRRPPQLTVPQIMVGNASLLSVMYLAAGAIVETLRRLRPAPWLERASLALESLPARALEVLGVMGTLREDYVYGRMSELWIRLIFGGTVVAIIFALAVGLGALMWMVRRVWYWQTARGKGAA